jgi:hypothetical protein
VEDGVVNMSDEITRLQNEADYWRKIANAVVEDWVPKEVKDFYVGQLFSKYADKWSDDDR